MVGGATGGHFDGAKVAEGKVGGGVVALEDEGAGGGAETLAGVLVGRSFVSPIADLVAVHPGGHVGTVDDEGFMEPLEVVSHYFTGGLATIETAGAVVERLGAVAVFVSVVDLTFVTVPTLAGYTAEKEAGIEMLAVGDALHLKHEVGELGVGFELAGSVFHVDFASGSDGKDAFFLLAGQNFPAGQVLAIKEVFEAQGFEFDVAKFDFAGVELQADVTTLQGLGVGEVEDDFVVEFHFALIALHGDVEGSPAIGFAGTCHLFSLNETAGGEGVVGRGNVQFVAVGGGVGGNGGSVQENAAVGATGGAEVGAKLIVRKLAGGAEQTHFAFIGGNDAVGHLPIDFRSGLPAKQGFAIEEKNPAIG